MPIWLIKYAASSTEARADPATLKTTINIATFHLGRAEVGGDAVALIQVDAPAPDAVMGEIHRLPQVKQVIALTF